MMMSDLRIYQLRFFRSNKFNEKNFIINKKKFTDKKDLIGERDLILEYIIEGIEISYTLYLLFMFLSYFSFVMIFMTLFTEVLFFKVLSIALSLIFWQLSVKKKKNLLIDNIGYDLAESIYNSNIQKMYNL